MSTLYSKYHAEINKWNWKGIIQDAKNNPQDDYANTEDEDVIGWAYLGTLINPSGKYYLPFACSNVDSCHSCKGSGINRIKKETCPICRGSGKRYLKDCEKYPAILEWIKKDNIPVYHDFLGKHFNDTFMKEYIVCNLCQGEGKISTTCKQCGGLGSNEAYKDQEFWQALDDIAAKYNGYITAGEGDLCDTFFNISVENPEAEGEVE